jgi:hypothetical protein
MEAKHVATMDTNLCEYYYSYAVGSFQSQDDICKAFSESDTDITTFRLK